MIGWMMAEHIIVTDEGSARIIRLRRPEKKNALTREMFGAMSRAIDTAQNNPTIRCLIITGGSGVFTAGNDLEDFVEASQGKIERLDESLKFLHSIVQNSKPIIAAVDGMAIGMGTILLFHCDYVLASTTATFSTPLIRFGLPPEGASSLLMPLGMGHHRAFAMLAMGRTLDAYEAQTAGFVNVVVAAGHVETEAKKAAREICALSPEAVAITRKLLKLPPDEMVRRIEHEGHMFGERMRTDEAIAAFDAFFARKKG